MQSHTWRLINSKSADGARNMSVDEAILASFAQNSSMPVLRLYGWDPPALSIGRFQKSRDEIDLESCHKDGVPLIRRITGGGALYHADELTYSMVCSPEQIPAASSVKDSFRILTGFLINFYCMLGLNASYALDTVSESERLGERTSFCFAGKETYDILVNGSKIGGNAQRRMKNIIFQHGSIPIVNRASIGLRYMKDQTPRLAEGATSLMECGIQVDADCLKRAMIDSFARQMGVSMQEDSLSGEEQSLSNKLLSNKYSTQLWNMFGEVR